MKKVFCLLLISLLVLVCSCTNNDNRADTGEQMSSNPELPQEYGSNLQTPAPVYKYPVVPPGMESNLGLLDGFAQLKGERTMQQAYIRDIYEKDGKVYIVCDDFETLYDEEAEAKAKELNLVSPRRSLGYRFFDYNASEATIEREAICIYSKNRYHSDTPLPITSLDDEFPVFGLFEIGNEFQKANSLNVFFDDTNNFNLITGIGHLDIPYDLFLCDDKVTVIEQEYRP